MTTPVQAIGAVQGADVGALRLEAAVTARPTGSASFGQMLLNGVDQVNDKLVQADAAARAFAVDDSIPLHQVMFAQAEARQAFELMLQVRSRLVEGYQDIMRMQL